jgi:hypothetical protein
MSSAGCMAATRSHDSNADPRTCPSISAMRNFSRPTCVQDDVIVRNGPD